MRSFSGALLDDSDTVRIKQKMSRCFLCPRKCGADRSTERGFCGEYEDIRVTRAAPHYWEEPCISGTKGSGTVFFSGCSLKCVFCQNASISRGMYGKTVTPAELCDIMMRLASKGVHNINFVTPTHFTPKIKESMMLARESGLVIPFVWNSSGYESVPVLNELDGLVDVYLPDLKYAGSYLAQRYSNASDYFDAACLALDEMVKQRGKAVFDENGLIKSGVIVRHLVLPGCISDSKTVLNHLHRRYGSDIYISIMRQYTPLGKCLPDELNRKLTDKEYDEITEYAALLGIVNGFLQESGAADESFIPEFDMRGIDDDRT